MQIGFGWDRTWWFPCWNEAIVDALLRRLATCPRRTGVLLPCVELLDAGFDLSISIGSIPRFVKPCICQGHPGRTGTIARSIEALHPFGRGFPRVTKRWKILAGQEAKR